MKNNIIHFTIFTMIIAACSKDDTIPNTAPAILDQSFTVSESLSDSEDIGSITATDPDEEDNLKFRIVTNPDDLFEIESESGVLNLTSGKSLDFESSTSHSIKVQVSDGELENEATITINVTDINEVPTTTDQAFTAAEDINDTSIIGVVDASDMDSSTSLNFTISSNENDLFEVNSANGEIRLATGGFLDFETNATHDITVDISDGSLTTTSQVSILVTDVNESPSTSNQTFVANENIPDTNEIGLFEATDPDVDAQLTYTILVNDDGLFEINASTGIISPAPGQNLDFEFKNSYTVTVEVSDGALTASGIVTITVLNINEPPVITSLTFEFAHAENISDSEIIGTITATDVDAGTTLTYNVAVNDNSLFEIESATGEVSLSSNKFLDFESKVVHEITVNVSDGQLSTSQLVTVNVTNVVDANVTTLAGKAGLSIYLDGEALAARFITPTDIAYDAAGNLFVVERSHTVRKIDNSGIVTTFAGVSGQSGAVDGLGQAARFNELFGIAIDATGNLFVADGFNHSIRKIDASGNVTTFAGSNGNGGSADGLGTAAQFLFPTGLVFDTSGNLYVADQGNHTIRKIDPSGNVSTFAGAVGMGGLLDAQGSTARFKSPSNLTIDDTGNLYLADLSNHAIRKIDPTGNVTTIAGNGSFGSIDGQGAAASFSFPTDVAIDQDDNLYVSDLSNYTIRKIDPMGNVTTLVGKATENGTADGPDDRARFYLPWGLTMSGSGSIIVADYLNGAIREIKVE